MVRLIAALKRCATQRPEIESKGININGGGQECPSYTSFVLT